MSYRIASLVLKIAERLKESGDCLGCWLEDDLRTTPLLAFSRSRWWDEQAIARSGPAQELEVNQS